MSQKLNETHATFACETAPSTRVAKSLLLRCVILKPVVQAKAEGSRGR